MKAGWKRNTLVKTVSRTKFDDKLLFGETESPNKGKWASTITTPLLKLLATLLRIFTFSERASYLLFAFFFKFALKYYSVDNFQILKKVLNSAHCIFYIGPHFPHSILDSIAYQ